MDPLVPQNTRWLPTRKSRQESRERLGCYSSAHFKSYADYFFFLHFDPVLRFWHAIGMWVGIVLFMITPMVSHSWIQAGVMTFLGFFYFYGFGLLSHMVYDGGAAKTEAGHFLDSMPTVMYINWLSTSGRYQKRLQAFITEYPFTVEVYRLVRRSELHRTAQSRVESQPHSPSA